MWIKTKAIRVEDDWASQDVFVNLAAAQRLLVEREIVGEQRGWEVVADFGGTRHDSRVMVKKCADKAEAEHYREQLIEALDRVRNVIVPNASTIP